MKKFTIIKYGKYEYGDDVYTLEELKKFFKINDEEMEEFNQKLDACADIYDIQEVLNEAECDHVYDFEEHNYTLD